MSTALQKGHFAEQWNSDIKENGFAQAPFAFFMCSLVDQSLPKTTNGSAKKAADERRGTGSLSFCKKMDGKPSFYDFSSFFFSFLRAQQEKAANSAKSAAMRKHGSEPMAKEGAGAGERPLLGRKGREKGAVRGNRLENGAYGAAGEAEGPFPPRERESPGRAMPLGGGSAFPSVYPSLDAAPLRRAEAEREDFAIHKRNCAVNEGFRAIFLLCFCVGGRRATNKKTAATSRRRRKGRALTGRWLRRCTCAGR